jgi:hypothetical protein
VADVFISYKSERRNAAQHLSRILELNGYSVWFDYGLFSGSDFGRQIEREIRAAKAVVVLWCSLSRESRWVLEEADLAIRLGTLTPAWLERVDPPLGFARVDTVDLTVWDGAPRNHLLDRFLNEIARRVGRDPVPSFRGLQAYEETWRSFGAPPLARFALTAPVAEREEERLRNDQKAREQRDGEASERQARELETKQKAQEEQEQQAAKEAEERRRAEDEQRRQQEERRLKSAAEAERQRLKAEATAKRESEAAERSGEERRQREANDQRAKEEQRRVERRRGIVDKDERERFKHEVGAKVEAEEKRDAMLAWAEAARRRDEEKELRRKTAPTPPKLSPAPATSGFDADVVLGILSIVAAIGLVWWFVGFSDFFGHFFHTSAPESPNSDQSFTTWILDLIFYVLPILLVMFGMKRLFGRKG